MSSYAYSPIYSPIPNVAGNPSGRVAYEQQIEIVNDFPYGLPDRDDAIKPKTEEEEYRNFIYLVMAGIGAYLILS